MMLDYTKYRLKKSAWLALIAVGAWLNLSLRDSWWGSIFGIVLIVAGASEYGFTCEHWRFKDVAKYLRENGYV